MPLRSDDSVFLKPEVKIEPLALNWYAWPHLIAPAQHAMNIAFRHLPLLQSFAANPTVHVAASRDPALFGGQFVDLSMADVPQVQLLLNRTRIEHARAIRLAHDLRDLDRQLQDEAKGSSLNSFYSRLPGSLRGLAEFNYDTNNHPKVRLYEPLLYDDDLCRHTQQICLSLVDERERSFFMSTPRLESPQNLIFPMRYADAKLDALIDMRSRARPLGEIMQILEIDAASERFEQLFTPDRTFPTGQEYLGGGVRLRYFGHACVLLQSAKTSVLVDPMLAFEPRADGRLTFDDLPAFIDYVVLTHGHLDHCSPEILIQLRQRVGKVVVPRNNSGSLADPSLQLMLGQLGYACVESVEAFEAIELTDGSIVSLPFPGEHVDLDIHSRQAVLVTLQDRRFLFLVDSDGWDSALYSRIVGRTGRNIDALFLGLECNGAPLSWLYGPLLTRTFSRRDDESRRLSSANSERAWRVLEHVNASQVFVYAMGQERWLRYIMGLEYSPDSIQLREADIFLQRCAGAGIAARKLQGSAEMIF